MDVLQCLVLAGSILRFVTSARDTIPVLNDIQESTDLCHDIDQLDAIIEEISAIQGSSRLANSSFFDRDQRPKVQCGAMAKFCEECLSLHKHLKGSVEEAQFDTGTRGHEAFCATKKIVGEDGKNHGLDKRLQELERQIEDYLPSHICSQKNAIERKVQKLAETSRRLNINQSKELQQLATNTDIAFQNLSYQSQGGQYGVSSSRRWIGSSSTLSGRMLAGDIVLAFSDIARQAIFYAAEFEIIKSLVPIGHGPRGGRDDSNPSASGSTCNSSKTCSVPDHFSEWLENGSGIFWILGDPGWGKSTFTRHLSSCAKTKDRLLKWSGTLPLVDIFCFSQGSHTRTQDSISDLLNTVVCQILKRYPELVAVAFPDQLKYIMRPPGSSPGTVTLSRKDLTHAIQSLAFLENLNTRFCFFVDDLDDYKNSEMEILTSFRRLFTSSCVKFCITNRLDSMSLDTLGIEQSQRLHLPDYTVPIIDQRIGEMLTSSSWIVQRKSTESNDFDQVFEYIRRESKGSFTWMDLALSTALSDEKISDDLGHLLARLKLLPTDSTGVFLHILNGVQDELQDRQARILLIASQAQEPLDLLVYSFLDEPDSDFVLSRVAVPMDQGEMERRSQLTKMRILSLCRGILETLPTSENSPRQLVTFSQNLIREYLRGADARELLYQRLTSPFDPGRTICNMLLARIKFHQMGPFWEEGGPIHGLVLHFLEEARVYGITRNEVFGKQINELEEVVCKRKGKTFWWWQKRSIEKGETTSTFLELMIQCRLVEYLKWRFEHCPNLTPGPLEMTNLLESTLVPPVGAQSSTEMVKAFLDHGADPNYPSDHGYHLDAKPTPWKLFLRHLVRSVQSGPRTIIKEDEQKFLTLKYLIQAGADLETPFDPSIKNGYLTSRLSMDEVIRMTTSREQYSILCRFIDERRNQKTARVSWLRWR